MLKIRDFRRKDLDKICGYKRESVHINFPDCRFNEDMFGKILLRCAKQRPDSVKIAEVDGKVAGYVWCRSVSSAVGVFGRIEHVFVDEKFRHRGVGKVLMQTAEEHFRSCGVKKIKLTVTSGNKSAVSLYNNMGYETRRFIMEKDL